MQAKVIEIKLVEIMRGHRLVGCLDLWSLVLWRCVVKEELLYQVLVLEDEYEMERYVHKRHLEKKGIYVLQDH